ncbi:MULTISPECIES: cell division protein FtsA [Pasteurellaceae]|uniref:Cell division protein FtsA n=1 Tax=Pasteurella atlantica TaxID=2827233 RepID=A0AAW8CNU1_9PAST|nr:cell division protein FtsA [Pasteurella atlantica]MBR0574037.1 cell division protein FtsA [Pasteurella atlantica]MDP8039999.1 cell division protein FtsA [Pasteurella atlantica]MDP8042113.1 cell division protein FtsA [Pasteurella atlantica]MDP8044251.1 cell division protein FtsA [Pasteurella atlantica]MDP8046312.1 cell division protein FtsA [Pasteurella atlantica]
MSKIAESKIIVSLEVGSSKIVTVVGEVLPDAVVNVLGTGVCPSKGIKRGSVVDLDAVTGAIKRAIEQAESIANCDIQGVTLAITGEHIQTLNELGSVALGSGEVTHADIEAAIRTARSVKLSEGVETLHIIPQEYKVDHLERTKKPLGLQGMRLQAQVHLITCHKDWLRNLCKAVENNKLNIDQVVFSGIASSYSVLTEDEMELGVCLVDIGGGTMDILVYSGGALRYSKVIPFAGNDITQYVSKVFTTSPNDAENIKVKYASAISPPSTFVDTKIEIPGLGGRRPQNITKQDFSSVISECYIDLLKLIQTELELLKEELTQRGIKLDLTAGVVLTGGGSQAEDIVECAKNVFGMAARVGYPLNITGLTDYVNKPQYATALGLLQYSYLNSDDINNKPLPSNDKGMLSVLKKSYNWIKSNF